MKARRKLLTYLLAFAETLSLPALSVRNDCDDEFLASPFKSIKDLIIPDYSKSQVLQIIRRCIRYLLDEDESEDCSSKIGKRKRKESCLLPGYRQLTVCNVCGDTCNGQLGYGAQVCYACKAFFRRVITKGATNSEKCPFYGSCIVTKESRSICLYCRLQKCYQYGMKEELVQKPHEIKHKKRTLKTSQQLKKSLEEVPKPTKTKTPRFATKLVQVFNTCVTINSRVEESEITSDGILKWNLESLKQLEEFAEQVSEFNR